MTTRYQWPQPSRVPRGGGFYFGLTRAAGTREIPITIIEGVMS
jgi:hypothetical protein